MIPDRVAAEIRRLYVVEGWRRNTIARHLRVHHGTVARALEREGLGVQPPARRASMLDPYVAFIRETLGSYPDLPASVLHEMVQKRGYPGGDDHFRHRIAALGLRPRKTPEAFLELRTLPGEQAQIDWADFGSREVLGGVRRLFAFVMVLSYSRLFFVRFFYDTRMPAFLAGHVLAFEFLGGVARVLLYDNLKTAVLERRGDTIRFHPRLLDLADYYGFEPRPVAQFRGNEKGRVERAIRYVRTSWFPLRRNWSIDALNRDALEWCRERASQRRWIQDRGRTVEQAFAEERPRLMPLRSDPFPCHERTNVVVRKTPVVSFDANRYSIPANRVARTLTVTADLDRVRILDQTEVVAEHDRSWDKGQLVENPAHTDDLRQAKRRARHHRGLDRLTRAVPTSQGLLAVLARRQRRLQTAVDRLLELLDEFGAAELRIAIDEALEAGAPHVDGVRLILDRRRHHRGQLPQIPVDLPDDPRIRHLVVDPHPLGDYDGLESDENDDQEDDHD